MVCMCHVGDGRTYHNYHIKLFSFLQGSIRVLGYGSYEGRRRHVAERNGTGVVNLSEEVQTEHRTVWFISYEERLPKPVQEFANS